MRKLKININKVSKKFGDKVVLKDLDLKVFESESLAIIGESGSGKSVLTKCIDGLLSFDTGTISFDKIYNIKNLSFLEMNKYMSKFGILFQNAALFDSLTIKENLMFANKNDNFSEILDEVSLPKSILQEFPSNLSIGVQKRIGLARAILQNPEILILDEPTTGLDPNARRDLWKILENFKATGTTLILTTHYMEEAQYLCERILIMDQGKLLAEGSLSDLLDKFGEGDFIEYSIDGVLPNEKVEKLPGVLNLTWDKNTGVGRLTVKQISKTLPLFLQLVENSSISLTSLECRRRTLDDLFLAMSGRRLDD